MTGKTGLFETVLSYIDKPEGLKTIVVAIAVIILIGAVAFIKKRMGTLREDEIDIREGLVDDRSRLREEIKDLFAEIDSLKDRLADREAEIDSLKRQLLMCQTRVVQLTGEFEEFNDVSETTERSGSTPSGDA